MLVVTAFTIAHSITLIGSAFGLAPDALWFPPLVETLIAASIVYMALENIVAASGGALESVEAAAWKPMAVAFGFGLVHGFGFSFAFARRCSSPARTCSRRCCRSTSASSWGSSSCWRCSSRCCTRSYRYVVAERVGAIILSALVAHTGWHWMIERGETLGRFDFVWPALDAASSRGVLRWAIVAVILTGLIWLVRTEVGS